ncbi:MAG TPA: hypothetical protein VGJ91_12785, partial [Polyangiaceae bacterium]
MLSDRCQELSNEGDYPGALQACEQAYGLNPDPGLLAYIAQIQTALLHPVQARDALVRYLHAGQLNDDHRKTAEAQVRYLETLIGTLALSTRLEGAELRVDEQVMDASALQRGVPLSTGAHRVTVQTKQATFEQFVFLRAGERTQLELPGSGSIALSCATPEVRFFIDDQELDPAQAARGSDRPAGSHRVTFKLGAIGWPTQQVTVNPNERVSVVCAPPPVGAAVPASAARPARNPRGYWVMGAGLALAGAALATAIYNGSEYDRWQTANDNLRRDLLA